MGQLALRWSDGYSVPLHLSLGVQIDTNKQGGRIPRIPR
jgi:hypothetical protein